ncbi:hypothetical protein RAA17_14870 [Komagataeibacter rhaeticus]|nr:hypothetical protein [Komagataeibacter rhaeticus]
MPARRFLQDPTRRFAFIQGEGYTLRIFLSRKNRGQAFNNVELSRNSIGRMIIIRPGARATPHIRLRMAIGPAAL